MAPLHHRGNSSWSFSSTSTSSSSTTGTGWSATSSPGRRSSQSSAGSRSGFLNVQLANGIFDAGNYLISGSQAQSTGNYFLGSGSSTSTQLLQPPGSLKFGAREDSTRVQLQRQRFLELQKSGTRRLVGRKIPGYRTSAAFFASLRTNLRLNASPPPSPMSTPSSMVNSAASLPPPSPLSGPADSAIEMSEPDDPLAGVPDLQSYVARTDEDRVAALRLIADSVAQMRQNANTALIFHPLNMALVVAFISFVARYMMDSRGHDWTVALTTGAGLVMIFLAVCRWLTQNYLFAAEEINWAWLGDADMLVTKFGEEIIGTVAIEWLSGESRQKRKKAWRGEIKAWTVRLKYRRKGVGLALLEDAVKEAKKKGAESIEFADEHANHKRILWKIYNSKFDKRERKSREILMELFESSQGRGKKR